MHRENDIPEKITHSLLTRKQIDMVNEVIDLAGLNTTIDRINWNIWSPWKEQEARVDGYREMAGNTFGGNPKAFVARAAAWKGQAQKWSEDIKNPESAVLQRAREHMKEWEERQELEYNRYRAAFHVCEEEEGE